MSIPNFLTLLRIILTPAFFTTLVSYTPEKESMRLWALLIFVVAALTDALDGILARVLKQKTHLGQLLDPLADKLLLLSGFVGILFVNALPYRPSLWILITIIFRDLILLVGFFALLIMRIEVDAKPNLLGKMTTAAQMLLLILILLQSPLVIPMAYVTVGFTIASGVFYVSKGLRLTQ